MTSPLLNPVSNYEKVDYLKGLRFQSEENLKTIKKQFMRTQAVGVKVKGPGHSWKSKI